MENQKLETITKLFEGSEIRSIWDSEKEEYYFSVVDVIGALTNANIPRNYWSDLKRKLKEEGSQLHENIVQLKMKAKDGKFRETDTLDTQGILRLIESVPSSKAEPFKLWLAQMGKERNDIYKTWSGMKASEYKTYKNIRKESLRDNMTDIEVALTDLGEIATRELAKKHKPQGLKANRKIAKAGGEVAKTARDDLEQKLGESVISSNNQLDYQYLDGNKKLESKNNTKKE